MQVRHDAMLRVIISSGSQILDTTEVPADQLEAHITVRSIIYNANPSTGGGLWWNPNTGRQLAKAPQYRYELVNPDDELVDGDLCPCALCVASAEAS